jgi:mRNA-degrading endonuclease toxin of MazEF toxin-antitoxin module
MTRGDIYRVKKPGGSHPKKFRLFVVVARQALIKSKFSTVVCAPIYAMHDGLTTQVALTNFVAALNSAKMRELNDALIVALAVEP